MTVLTVWLNFFSQLHKFGFTNIDALDGSKEMMEEAKKLGIYKDFYVEYIGPNKLTIETSKCMLQAGHM